MNPLDIRGQIQSHLYGPLLTEVIKEQVGDEEGEAAGCHKQGRFQKLNSGCSAFLSAFS